MCDDQATETSGMDLHHWMKVEQMMILMVLVRSPMLVLSRIVEQPQSSAPTYDV